MATTRQAGAPKEKAGSVAKTSGTAPQVEDVMVTVSMELGRNRMTLDELLNIGDQSLIELDKVVGEPIDILLNGKVFARGEVVTVAENFGVKVTEILSAEQTG